MVWVCSLRRLLIGLDDLAHDGLASRSRTYSKGTTQHIRLRCLHDAFEHSYILTLPSSLAPLRPYAGRYAFASRFRRQPCDCGIHCSRASRRIVTAPPLPRKLHAMGRTVKSGSPPCQTIIFNSFQLAAKRKQGIGGVGIQLRKDPSGRQRPQNWRLATRTGAIARVSARSGVVVDPRHTYKLHAREPGDLGNTCRQTRQQVGGRRR
jgi:hypothetical protein